MLSSVLAFGFLIFAYLAFSLTSEKEMGTRRSTTVLFFLARMPLVILYACFFLVQLFHNFDIASHAQAVRFVARIQHTNDHVQPQFAKSGALNQKAGSFRLNKRYHPQDAITCQAIVIEPLACPVFSKLHIHFSSGFEPHDFPSAQLLRGPPVVSRFA